MPPKKAARFIEPMLLLRTDALPNNAGNWEYQLKLDGYRAIAFKTRGRVQLRSRNDNDFSIRSSPIRLKPTPSTAKKTESYARTWNGMCRTWWMFNK